MIKQQSISFEVTEYETENQNKKLSTPNFNSPEAFQKIPNKTRKHSQHKQHVKSLHQHANLNSADTLENDPRIHGRKTQTGGQFKKFVLKVIEWIQKSIALGGNENESGGSPDEVQLDAEMDKVFAGSSQDKFDVTKFSSPTDGNPAKYKINEYEGAQRKKISVGKTKKDSGDRSDTVSPTSSVSPVSSPSLFKEKMQRNVDTGNNKDRDDDDDDQPLVSERAGYGDHSSDSSSEYRRVQFERNMPQTSESFRSPSDEGFDPNNDDHRKRKGRHEHYKVRKYSLQESRKQSGSDPPSGRKISVQPEDAQLEEADIDDLTSHRSDDPRGRRRNKIVHSNDGRMVEKLSNTTGQKTTKQGFPRKHFDHSPHEVFVQLDELKGTGEDREWKETARWIKYEEDVEEGSDRWGRPHVASLSFHSLLNLRRCLETGVVLMDLEERDLPGVAYRVVEQMVIEELIHEEDKPTLMRSLLLRHRHVNEHSQLGFSFGKRKISSYTSLQNLWMYDANLRNRSCSINEGSISVMCPINNRDTEHQLQLPVSTVNESRGVRRHSTMSYKLVNFIGFYCIHLL